MERRRANRFELRSPVIIRWRDDNEIREAQVMSDDISSNGIYFVMSASIKEGTPVELEITLPNQITCAGPVRVSCFGHIQRCEPKEGANVGMAVAIEKYEFLRGKAPVSDDVRQDFNVPEAE
jgi:hypothetical protein